MWGGRPTSAQYVFLASWYIPVAVCLLLDMGKGVRSQIYHLLGLPQPTSGREERKRGLQCLSCPVEPNDRSREAQLTWR